MMLKVAFFILAGFLVSCAAPKKPVSYGETIYWQQKAAKLIKINTWRIEGRLKLKQNSQSNVVSIIWTKEQDVQNITLLAPLGQSVLKLKIMANNTRVQLADGRVFFDNDPQALIKKLTRLDVPIKPLTLWVLGKTERANNNSFDEFGRLITSSLKGWQLNISEYAQVSSTKHGAIELPSTINISNDETSLVLVVNSWNIDSAKEALVFDDELLTIPVFR